MQNDDKFASFKRKLDEIIKDIGIRELIINEKEIIKFCELINDNNEIYYNNSEAKKSGFEGKLVPPGYIMNLTNPYIQKIFIKGGAEFFPGLIKGVIHVGSKIKYFKPMIMDKKFKIKIENSEPVEKSGEKGSYYSVIIKLSILDQEDTVYAIDNHEFFFKLN
ncbi:MAG: hypothetical protein GF329_14535 [Candidatus Lokiarchaeota archaeon]|nr:hypothetical protein [Candidatus Lokiarchaeota archaeon]